MMRRFRFYRIYYHIVLFVRLKQGFRIQLGIKIQDTMLRQGSTQSWFSRESINQRLLKTCPLESCACERYFIRQVSLDWRIYLDKYTHTYIIVLDCTWAIQFYVLALGYSTSVQTSIHGSSTLLFGGRATFMPQEKGFTLDGATRTLCIYRIIYVILRHIYIH